ncbi:PilW family protein [Stutzerimonas nitrititolerans]|uniref:PilW family protein n=1 Tax=Stutzerimonas nitrititolerans TaxID=2482751 RepID=UPI00289F5671|nr:PilW family protein [Stutzerimonas nitrititolerans]
MISSKAQAGLSIVELLVALVISMLLMTGVVQVFLASKQTYASNEAASRLQENGRFALEFIAQSARHAGYVEAVNNTLESLPRPVLAPNDDDCAETLCSSQGIDDNPDASDSIAFSFQPRLLDGARRDCLGKTSGNGTTIGNTDVIINHFYIVYEGTGNASLGCASTITPKSESDNNVLVEGIDALQIQYGIGTNSGVTQYVSADRVNDWNNVLAIRIAVLANSINPVNPPPPPGRQYVLLDAPPLNFDNDPDEENRRKARQVFTTTIKLRNTGEL